MKTLKKQLDSRVCIPLEQRVINCRDLTRQRKGGLGLKAVKCGKVPSIHVGETPNKGFFMRYFCADSSQVNSLCVVIKMCSSGAWEAQFIELCLRLRSGSHGPRIEPYIGLLAQ